MDLAELLLWLCRIPSPIGEERTLCDAVAQRCAALPLAAAIRRYGDSLVVPLTRGTGGPHIALAGHLDVVRTEHTQPPRIEGDKLFGPGAADMKSGLCLMLELAAAPPPGIDFTLVFYAREEGPYAENELGPVLEQDGELLSANLAIALEPSDNKLQLGCGGSLHAAVRFLGKTAHSARPWQGENAIYKAAPLLATLRDLSPQPFEIQGLVWNEVISATLAKGGRGRNIIPDEFELNLNYRFSPATTLERAEARLMELVGSAAELTFVDRSPSALPRRDHPLVQTLSECGVRAVEPKQAWTDVARFSALGIAAVNFGPGVQAQAHQRDEWTLISQLSEGSDILRRFFERIRVS